MRKSAFGILIFAFLAFISCDSLRTEKMYRQGAVACSEASAADIGLHILKNDGNAVDAACAVALALAVTYPQAGNIGGGGFALIYMTDSQQVYFIDFRETAPAAATAAHFLDSAGRVDSIKAVYGPLSSGTPGTVAGLYEMHQRFGRLNWSELVRPARVLADTGFIAGPSLVQSLKEEAAALRRYPSTEAVFFPDGKILEAGRRLIQPDLAATLDMIEQNGRDGFYLGETAEAIEKFCAANGGLISAEDLKNYRPVWRRPAHFRFRNLDIYTSGLPSSGGAVMGQILRMLETYELERYTADSPQYIHLFAEAARRAYADRSAYLGDPDFVSDPTGQLLDDAYIASRIQSIDPDHASSSADILPGMPRGRRESDQTTHLVVSDRNGNIVTLTYTVNAWFGCKAVVPGGGFFLNNEMDDFALVPGTPNQFGLIGSETNRVEPGKRMLSSMSPTIVFKSNRPSLALGSPGGSRIITAVAQTILNYHVFGMSLTGAVTAPRFHHQWQPDILYVERGGYEVNVIQKLIGMGHTVIERTPYGEVMALGFSPDGIFITPVADPRRGGGTAKGY